MALASLELRLEARWKLKGHDIRFVEVTVNGSRLGCKNCLQSVVVTYDRGGWILSSRDLDKECSDEQG